MTATIIKSDALEFLRAQPADSVDLVLFSPPYVDCRLYLEDGSDMGIAISDPEEWSRWMVEVFKECRRVCKGLVACVCDGKTEDFAWKPAPLLLGADLYRAGFTLRKPPIFHRVGIPGSGGPDWFRGDCEFIICTTRPGKLPWSDNTACGHVPKWAPGGEMSNRMTDGQRVNRDKWGNTTEEGSASGEGRHANGKRKTRKRRAPVGKNGNGDVAHDDAYDPPALANPGNVVVQVYTADEVVEFLKIESDFQHCIVGGGLMGEQSDMASKNEAPFPEELVERYVLSFCPPGGTVLDCFSGSGTTAAVSVRHGRNFCGCDIRQSQVDLGLARVGNETPLSLFME